MNNWVALLGCVCSESLIFVQNGDFLSCDLPITFSPYSCPSSIPRKNPPFKSWFQRNRAKNSTLYYFGKFISFEFFVFDENFIQNVKILDSFVGQFEWKDNFPQTHELKLIL